MGGSTVPPLEGNGGTAAARPSAEKLAGNFSGSSDSWRTGMNTPGNCVRSPIQEVLMGKAKGDVATEDPRR